MTLTNDYVYTATTLTNDLYFSAMAEERTRLQSSDVGKRLMKPLHGSDDDTRPVTLQRLMPLSNGLDKRPVTLQRLLPLSNGLDKRPVILQRPPAHDQ